MAEFADLVFSKRIPACTLCSSNKYNLERPAEEVEAIKAGISYGLESELPKICNKWNPFVRLVGDTSHLESAIVEEIAMRHHSSSKRRRLYICLWYDPFEELRDAIESITDWQNPLSGFWLPEKVDVLVRTGGARTLSNFIPLQCGYARLVFLDKLFNDLTRNEIEEILNSIGSEDIKYGL
jgi:undecaprenyl diphosphate synthase